MSIELGFYEWYARQPWSVFKGTAPKDWAKQARRDARRGRK